MIDQVKIDVKAGDGGSGCNSFKGKKFGRWRHPDGGSGGDGADIVIKVDQNIQGLEDFQFKQHFRAANGKSGQANKKKGADGRPCIINVPAGTVVRDIKNNLFLQDLTEPGEEFIVAKGGAGGKANARTKLATAGLPGEERTLFLELKLVTDVAIVGYPNSGKSTLLSKMTSGKPKIASYPFTTSVPFLGVLNFEDFEEPSSLTCIEIPALIKGSGQGKGLGAKFLRHAERAGVLIHIVDMASPEGRSPLEDYNNLNQELQIYDPQLSKKPKILVANKMDLPQARANLISFSGGVKEQVYAVCALEGTGIKELLEALRAYFRKGKQDG